MVTAGTVEMVGIVVAQGVGIGCCCCCCCALSSAARRRICFIVSVFEREAVEGENEFEEAEAGLLHSASTGGAWKFDRPAGVG